MSKISVINVMEQRQVRLLKLIIENYIETAEPVGSNFLVTTAGLELSGATVRNEMRELEEAGYLTHPHTSAGRIPTEAGYRYYVEHLMKPVSVKKKFQDSVGKIVAHKQDRLAKQKEMGKAVAGFIGNAVIISTNRDTIYYTGLSYLFAQPEFHDAAVMVNISAIFDNYEDRLDDMYNAVEPGETKILIGHDNPLGSDCSTVVIRDSNNNLFAILGPIRMDYGEHIGIMGFIRGLI